MKVKRPGVKLPRDLSIANVQRIAETRKRFFKSQHFLDKFRNGNRIILIDNLPESPIDRLSGCSIRKMAPLYCCQLEYFLSLSIRCDVMT